MTGTGLFAVRKPAQEVAPTTMSPYDKIRTMEAMVPLVFERLLDIDGVTSHEWCDGVYCRRFFLEKDAMVVSKVHRKQNWFLLFSGEVSVYDGTGTTVRLKAPFLMVTQPATKRVVYAHEDAVIYTFHGNPDNETDLDKLEERYVIPEAVPTLPAAEMQMLLEHLK